MNPVIVTAIGTARRRDQLAAATQIRRAREAREGREGRRGRQAGPAPRTTAEPAPGLRGRARRVVLAVPHPGKH
jgi:hypothetical protein